MLTSLRAVINEYILSNMSEPKRRLTRARASKDLRQYIAKAQECAKEFLTDIVMKRTGYKSYVFSETDAAIYTIKKITSKAEFESKCLPYLDFSVYVLNKDGELMRHFESVLREDERFRNFLNHR